MQLMEVNPGSRCPASDTSESHLGSPADGGWRDKPDEHWVNTRGSAVTARCSLWWRNTPPYLRHRVGFIGHYAADDADSAAALMEHACGRLRQCGCTLVVGPMDGSSWKNYRFVTSFGDEPRFAFEPTNPPEWPEQFRRSGFQPLADYFSAIDSLTDSQHGFHCIQDRLTDAGVAIRPLCPDTFDEDLRRILVVTRRAFVANPLYSDPEESEFIEQFRRLRLSVPLDLTWIAECESTPVGFVFTLPDLCEQAREGKARTLIIKTLAVVPDRLYAGLGLVLLNQARQRASELGFLRAIHALVRNVGSLRRLSGRFAQPIRRYTLFTKELRR
jgi:GNAT superfamily N-acetyltransferase